MKTGAGSAAFFDRSVEEIFDAYPPLVQKKLLDVRELIFQVAESYPEIGLVQECLKWGEPSYLAKGGSTLRMNARGPDKYAVYFHCKTRLVETFKEIYGDFFCYEANRALVFSTVQDLPKDALWNCIAASLRYHRVKHLPLLGM